MDDFKDAPQTISEIRSDRSQLGKDWAPRDVLVSLLRGIDSGELKTDSLVVFFKCSDDKIEFRQACSDPLSAMGLVYTGSLSMYRAFTA